MKIKKILLAVIVLLLSFGIGFPVKAEESKDGNYTYSLAGENATITKYLGSGGGVSIPSEIDGYAVVKIGSEAFFDCKEVTSVTIPNTVTVIGHSAFKGTSISSLRIPDSVTSLGAELIAGTNVTTITIPKSVTWAGATTYSDIGRVGPLGKADELKTVYLESGMTEIPANLCCYVKIPSINIPDTVTAIRDHAFQSCVTLKSIDIPKGVTCIEEGAFHSCENLESITIPEKVVLIGNYAFENCTSLKTVTFENNSTTVGVGELTLGNYAFSGCTNLSQITWPENLIKISGYCFRNCSSLTSVKIPDTVDTIGAWAFQGCTKLAEIELSDSLSELGQEFIADTKVVTITIPKSLTLAGSVEYSGAGRFGPLGKAEYLKTVVFEEGMTAIPADICCHAKITSVSIPDTVTWIGRNAFAYCSELTGELSFPNVTTIEPYAFFNCESLTGFDTGDAITFSPTAAIDENVTMGGALLTIGEHAFDCCKNLNGAFGFSESFSKIGSYAFSGCEEIDTFYFAGPKPSIGVGAFTGVTAECYYRNNNSSWDEIRETPEKHQYYGELTWTVWYDFWSIVNSNGYFGADKDGYFITRKDMDTLLLCAEDDDVKAIFESWYNIDGKTKRKNITKEWEGSCYGLSAWVLMLDDGTRYLEELDNNVDTLYDVPLSNNVESAINFYHHQQLFLADCSVEFQKLSLTEQLKAMENAIKKGLAIISFAYETDEGEEEHAVIGHAVIGYGIEKGTWEYGDDVYHNRVLIYDNAYPTGKEEFFLYYNTGEKASWYIPGHKTEGDDNELSGNVGDGKLTNVLSGGTLCNSVDYKTGVENKEILQTFIDTGLLNSASGSEYTLKWSDYSCDITGGIVKESNYGDDIYINIPSNTTTDGNTTESTLSLFLPEKGQDYTVISLDDSMKYSLLADDYYGGVYMESSGEILFDAKDGLGVKADEETKMQLFVTYNEDSFMSEYNDIHVEAENATELTVSKTKDGVVLESDNLENVTVIVENDEESKEVVIESDKTNVLLKDKGDGSFEVMEDEDGDGVYDGLEEEVCEHDYKTVIVKNATCETNGLQQEVCSLCKEVKEGSDTVIKATGHTWGKGIITKATTSKNGKITYTCTTCQGQKNTVIYYPKTIVLSTSSYTYNGKVKTPAVTVKGADGKTISSSNYTVTYASGRKNVGKYTVKVTFKGNYSGTATKYFNIVPKGTKISKLTKAKKAFTVKWKKQSAKMAKSRVTGYQVQYATNKSFTKDVKTKTVSGYSKTSKKITKLKAKKTYYVRIRTYKTISGMKYYSGWSTVKSVKTK